MLLSHADHSRLYIDRARLSAVSGPVQGTVLSDGFVCGVWHIEHARADARTTLVVEHVVPLTKRAAGAIAAEGERYLGFVAADVSGRDVRLGLRDLSLPVNPGAASSGHPRDDDDVVLISAPRVRTAAGSDCSWVGCGVIQAGALESPRGVH